MFETIILEYDQIYERLAKTYSFAKPKLVFRKLAENTLGSYHNTNDMRTNEIIIDNNFATNGDPEEITQVLCHEFAHAIMLPISDTLSVMGISDDLDELIAAKYLTPAIRAIWSYE